MKIKTFSVMISGVLMTTVTPNIYANAVEETPVSNPSSLTDVSIYAAGLISDYALSCAGDSKTVYINAEVYGSDIMAKIGFKNIKIQRSPDKDNWTTEKTVSDQISEDTMQKILSRYAVSVKGGYYYRIVLDNYAKEDAFWFPESQTVSATSNSVWIP